MTYDQEIIKQLAKKIKAQGFRVFIGESGTHGFYTDKELKRLVSFQYSLGLSFSGNYVTDNPQSTGQGWRIADGDNGTYGNMLAASAPHWAICGATKWSFKTVKRYLKEYQRSSKFKELKIKPLEWSELWDAMKADPAKWQPTTENMYHEMLGALPPQDMCPGAFLVGEPSNHNNEGFPIYTCFKKAGKNYEARDMTQQEFNKLKGVRA